MLLPRSQAFAIALLTTLASAPAEAGWSRATASNQLSGCHLFDVASAPGSNHAIFACGTCGPRPGETQDRAVVVYSADPFEAVTFVFDRAGQLPLNTLLVTAAGAVYAFGDTGSRAGSETPFVAASWKFDDITLGASVRDSYLSGGTAFLAGSMRGMQPYLGAWTIGSAAASDETWSMNFSGSLPAYALFMPDLSRSAAVEGTDLYLAPSFTSLILVGPTDGDVQRAALKVQYTEDITGIRDVKGVLAVHADRPVVYGIQAALWPNVTLDRVAYPFAAPTTSATSTPSGRVFVLGAGGQIWTSIDPTLTDWHETTVEPRNGNALFAIDCGPPGHCAAVGFNELQVYRNLAPVFDDAQTTGVFRTLDGAKWICAHFEAVDLEWDAVLPFSWSGPEGGRLNDCGVVTEPWRRCEEYCYLDTSVQCPGAAFQVSVTAFASDGMSMSSAYGMLMLDRNSAPPSAPVITESLTNDTFQFKYGSAYLVRASSDGGCNPALQYNFEDTLGVGSPTGAYDFTQPGTCETHVGTIAAWAFDSDRNLPSARATVDASIQPPDVAPSLTMQLMPGSEVTETQPVQVNVAPQHLCPSRLKPSLSCDDGVAREPLQVTWERCKAPIHCTVSVAPDWTPTPPATVSSLTTTSDPFTISFAKPAQWTLGAPPTPIVPIGGVIDVQIDATRCEGEEPTCDWGPNCPIAAVSAGSCKGRVMYPGYPDDVCTMKDGRTCRVTVAGSSLQFQDVHVDYELPAWTIQSFADDATFTARVDASRCPGEVPTCAWDPLCPIDAHDACFVTFQSSGAACAPGESATCGVSVLDAQRQAVGTQTITMPLPFEPAPWTVAAPAAIDVPPAGAMAQITAWRESATGQPCSDVAQCSWAADCGVAPTADCTVQLPSPANCDGLRGTCSVQVTGSYGLNDSHTIELTYQANPPPPTALTISEPLRPDAHEPLGRAPVGGETILLEANIIGECASYPDMVPRWTWGTNGTAQGQQVAVVVPDVCPGAEIEFTARLDGGPSDSLSVFVAARPPVHLEPDLARATAWLSCSSGATIELAPKIDGCPDGATWTVAQASGPAGLNLQTPQPGLVNPALVLDVPAERFGELIGADANFDVTLVGSNTQQYGVHFDFEPFVTLEHRVDRPEASPGEPALFSVGIDNPCASSVQQLDVRIDATNLTYVRESAKLNGSRVDDPVPEGHELVFKALPTGTGARSRLEYVARRSALTSAPAVAVARAFFTRPNEASLPVSKDPGPPPAQTAEGLGALACNCQSAPAGAMWGIVIAVVALARRRARPQS